MATSDIRTAGWLVAGLVAFALAAVTLAENAGVNSDVLLRDPSSQFDIPIYAGLISELGIAALFAAAVLLFAASRLSARPGPVQGLAAGVTFLLAFDDRFMLHDRYAARFLGIGEKPVFAVYLALVAILISLRLREAGPRGHGVLWLSLVMLAASAGVDLLSAGTFPLHLVVEDTLKLAGWGFWACYWSGVALHAMGKTGVPMPVPQRPSATRAARGR